MEKKFLVYSLLAILMFAVILWNVDWMGSLHNPKNYLGFHTLFEFFSIAISFTIFTYSWRRYTHTKSNQLLYMAMIFFIVGLLDLLHTVTFKGMPYFFGESTVRRATWFWVSARVSEAVLMTIFLFFPSRRHKRDMRLLLISVAAFYVALLAIIVFRYELNLPALVVEGHGTTFLKNFIEYFVSLLQLVTVIISLHTYRKTKRSLYSHLAVAFLFLFLSELIFTLYLSVFDVLNFAGHIYKVIGYYFVLQGIFFKQLDYDRRREEEIHRARQELDETISEHQGIIFKIKKIGERYVHTLCNGELLKKINLSPELVVGKTVYESSPHLAEKVNAFYREAWEGRCNVSYEVELEGLNLYTSLKPLIYKGEVIELVGSMVDITRLKQMEDIVRNNEKLGVLGELAAGIAHEVRNPLTTLKGFLQLLNSDMDEHKRNFVALMLSEVDRIEMITDEFMSVARPQATVHTRADVLEIIEQVRKFMQPQALLKGVQMNISSNGEIPEIMCEKNQLKQVFINIIKNSIDAMPAGGNLTVKALLHSSSEIQLVFSDEGVGIPEEALKRIGEPFFTSKSGGHGLGLMMCKKIIDQHKGRMEIKSKVGEGTVFIFTLPINLNVEGIEETRKIV